VVVFVLQIFIRHVIVAVCVCWIIQRRLAIVHLRFSDHLRTRVSGAPLGQRVKTVVLSVVCLSFTRHLGSMSNLKTHVRRQLCRAAY